LRELYKKLDRADIKGKRLECTGLIARIDQGRTVKKIFESKLDEVEEGEDLDCDGWTMLRRICGR